MRKWIRISSEFCNLIHPLGFSGEPGAALNKNLSGYVVAPHTGQMLILRRLKAGGLLVLVMLISFNWKGKSIHCAQYGTEYIH